MVILSWNKIKIYSSCMPHQNSSGILWSAGLHELRRLLLDWLPLRTCFLRRIFRRCSNDRDGADDCENNGWWTLLLPTLITSSICFRSCFFTTIFILKTPSSSLCATILLPPFTWAMASSRLPFTPLCPSALQRRSSFFCEAFPSATTFDAISIFLSLKAPVPMEPLYRNNLRVT